MLVNEKGKIYVVNEEDHVIDEDKLRKDYFNMIKNLKFSNDAFNWYILTRKDTQDFELYRDIIAKKNIKKIYKQVIKNMKKNGSSKMSYDDLLNLYISKRFNQRILKPMCTNALKHNWKAVNELALLK